MVDEVSYLSTDIILDNLDNELLVILECLRGSLDVGRRVLLLGLLPQDSHEVCGDLDFIVYA